LTCTRNYSSWHVGRKRISFTSTSSGWLMAKTTARANGISGNRIFLIESCGCFWRHPLSHAVRQLSCNRSRRDHRRADVVWFHFLPQPFGESPHGMLGRRIDAVAWTDLMASHRGDIDDMPGLLLHHNAAALQRCRTAPLMLTSIVRSQSSILRRSSGESGINPALLIMTSIRPYVCTAGVNQPLHLVTVGDIVHTASALPPRPVNSSANDWRRSTRRAPSTSTAPLCGEKPGGSLAQPAARNP